MTTLAAPTDVTVTTDRRAWAALGTLCFGFFLILVDLTIVSVATPAILDDLHTDVNQALWVTSAYLLAYAVPVLVTGRLGDRFGAKRLYLLGLSVFTLASLWCGLSGTIGMLIAARVLQGVGAAMMAPQTMAIITRIFPAQTRGRAMSMWGLTVGVSTLMGPLLGGVLTDGPGWQWIFLINIPLGLVALGLALRYVPELERHAHSFDVVGVALSGVGMFLLVFGIQQGHQEHWSAEIWTMIAGGVVVLGLFVGWQRLNRKEPLLPLRIFRDRNFSLGNLVVAVMGAAIVTGATTLMLYAEGARGDSPTKASLFLVPMAVTSIAFAPSVGRLTDRIHPRLLLGVGFVVIAASFFWLSAALTPSSPAWSICGATAGIGIGNAFIWAPNSATTTRNLSDQMAGAGAGIYNATRQIGSVVGTALLAVIMDTRLSAYGLDSKGSPEAGVGHLPAVAVEGFAKAMSQSMLLPPIALLIGLVAVLFFERPRHLG